MPFSILVATPHAAFGELLRLSLEESKAFQVRLVLSVKEAQASAARSNFDLAIIDSDLPDGAYTSLSFELLSLLPRMKLVIIPPENDPNHPSLGGLIPHGYLSRPFYLPDLLDTVSHLIQEPQSMPPAVQHMDQHTSLPEWLRNSEVLNHYLEVNLEGCDAIAALIGSHGELLGSTGKLDPTASQEMASILLRFWNPNEKTDLMRYIRLAKTKGDYLVYATEVVLDVVLIMVFEPGAQLSQIRPQTKQIAQNLASLPSTSRSGLSHNPMADDLVLTGSKNGKKEKLPSESAQANPPVKPAIFEPETEQTEDEGLYSVDGESFVNARGLPADLSGSATPEPDEDSETIDFDLARMLGTVPSPDPEKDFISSQPTVNLDNIFNGWVPERGAWTPPHPAAGESDGLDETDFDDVLNSGETQEVRSTADVSKEFGSTTQPYTRSAGDGTPHFLLDPEPEIDPLGDTRPHVVSTLSNLNQLEPVSPALSLLNYTCVLLPRFPQHYLTGELADKLAQWVQQLSLAFGWRLEGISLRPEYLQWTVQVAPSVSPGNLVRIIRQRTSLHIFNVFEHYKQQNPSGDFWATGYLIVSGPQPPSAQLLRDYISQTRKRQGILKA
jgi:DNA-binding NarL/FixJ family response regulator/REP element-mobilizing transposase RayT